MAAVLGNVMKGTVPVEKRPAAEAERKPDTRFFEPVLPGQKLPKK